MSTTNQTHYEGGIKITTEIDLAYLRNDQKKLVITHWIGKPPDEEPPVIIDPGDG